MKLGAALPLVLLALELAATAAASQNLTATYFRRLRVHLCLRSEFVAESPGKTLVFCAGLCLSRGFRCRGFRLTEAFVCQMFEFDRCDHELNEPDCNQLDWAYVRAQAGLPHGQLCPDGFGHGYLGSTYKMINVSSWTDGLNKCSSEPGELTKYADGNDRAEVDHFHNLRELNSDLLDGNSNFYVGGNRSNALDNWSWYDCGTAFLPEVWGPGQPNDFDTNVTGAGQNNKANVWYNHAYGLDDEKETTPRIPRALCECVDPFYY